MLNKIFKIRRVSIFAFAFLLPAMAPDIHMPAQAFTITPANIMPSGPMRAEPHFKWPEAALAKGKFLVAGRNMRDPRFAEAVILLTYYGADGASGIIINHPGNVKLSDVMPGAKEFKRGDIPVYFGGPVDIGRMTLLVRAASGADAPEDSTLVFADVYASTSAVILMRLMRDTGGMETFRMYAGYAGWAPGQLEREWMKGAWQVVDGDAEVVFAKDPLSIWPGLIR